VSHESIYDHRPPIHLNVKVYDVVYFSGSFMLMPDPVKCLLHVKSIMAAGGTIIFTQTFQEYRNPLVDFIKPILKFLTTIDFGNSTYEVDFLRALKEGGVEVIDMTNISTGFMKSTTVRCVRAKIIS
jgi:hypothetical protein